MQIYFNIRDISPSKASIIDDDLNEEKSRTTSGEGVFEQIIQVLKLSSLSRAYESHRRKHLPFKNF
jgi:hypothetical protein